jgi:hypothetical protein
LSIHRDWKTSYQEWNLPHTAVYLFEKPIVISEGGSCQIQLPKNKLGAFRLSLSPLAFTKPNQSPETLLAAENLGETHLVSTHHQPEAAKQYQTLFREWLACRDGKTHTLITQSTAPIPVRVLPRGNWMDETGELVTPQTPHFLPALRKMDHVRGQSAHPPDVRESAVEGVFWQCPFDCSG